MANTKTSRASTILGVVSAFLVGCSCGAAEAPIATSEPVSSPSAVAPDPVSPSVVEPTPAPDPALAIAVPTGADRCEGLVGTCGGWEGCVMVRADASVAGRFVGVGPNVGHLYEENHECLEGVCNEICTGGSLSGCRPGVTERVLDIACSGAHAPVRAPFTCRMQDGACVQGPDPDMIPAS